MDGWKIRQIIEAARDDLVCTLLCNGRRSDNEAATEYVNGLVVIRPDKSPLARITVVGVIAATSAYNEWSVPVIEERVSKDGFIPAINIKGGDL